MEDFGIWDEHGAVKDHVLDSSIRSQAVVDKHGKLRHLKAQKKKHLPPRLAHDEHRHKKSDGKNRCREKEKKKSGESRKRKRSDGESRDKAKKQIIAEAETNFGPPPYANPPFELVQRPKMPSETASAPTPMSTDQPPCAALALPEEGATEKDNQLHQTLFFPFQNLLATNHGVSGPQVMYPLYFPPSSHRHPGSETGPDANFINVVVANQHRAALSEPNWGVMPLGAGPVVNAVDHPVHRIGDESATLNSKDKESRSPSSNSNTPMNEESECSGTSSSALVLNDPAGGPTDRDRGHLAEGESSEHSITTVPRTGGVFEATTLGSSKWMTDIQNTPALMMNYSITTADVKHILLEDKRRIDAMLAGKNPDLDNCFAKQLQEFFTQQLVEKAECSLTPSELAQFDDFFNCDVLSIIWDAKKALHEAHGSPDEKAEPAFCCHAHSKTKEKRPSQRSTSMGNEATAVEASSATTTTDSGKDVTSSMATAPQPEDATKLYPNPQMMDTMDNHSNASADSGENGGKTSVVSANSANSVENRSDLSKNSLGSSENSKISSELPTDRSAVSLTSSIKESDKNGSDSDSSSLGSGSVGQVRLADAVKHLFEKIFVGKEVSNASISTLVERRVGMTGVTSAGLCRSLVDLENKGDDGLETTDSLRGASTKCLSTQSEVEVQLQELLKDATSGMSCCALSHEESLKGDKKKS